MGYSLINENVLSSVLSVRDRFLKADGDMIPRRAVIMVAAFEEILILDDRVLREFQSSPRLEAIVDICSKEDVISSAATVLELDLKLCSLEGNSFKKDFSVEATRSGTVSGLAIWFDAELSASVLLSTSPFSAPTHWKQTLLYLSKT